MFLDKKMREGYSLSSRKQVSRMLSETLATGLQRYRIGQKLRTLRTGKKLSLVELGEHSGLSTAMLSKIERGQMIPTLPTLLRIALVFGVGLEHFFAETEEKPLASVVRRGERLRLPNRAGEDLPAYLFESLDFPVTDRRMEAYLAVFPLRSKPSEPHKHDGAELIYVFKGELVVSLGEDEITLAEGDALYFDSATPHSYRRTGKSSCSAMVVVAK